MASGSALLIMKTRATNPIMYHFYDSQLAYVFGEECFFLFFSWLLDLRVRQDVLFAQLVLEHLCLNRRYFLFLQLFLEIVDSQHLVVIIQDDSHYLLVVTRQQHISLQSLLECLVVCRTDIHYADHISVFSWLHHILSLQLDLCMCFAVLSIDEEGQGSYPIRFTVCHYFMPYCHRTICIPRIVGMFFLSWRGSG